MHFDDFSETPRSNDQGESVQTGPSLNETQTPRSEAAPESGILIIWEKLSHLGLAESILRAGTHLLSIALVLVVVWVMREFYLRAQVVEAPREAALAAEPVLPTPLPPLKLPKLSLNQNVLFAGIPRLALLDTATAAKPRIEVITYEVKDGDTVFGIADMFGLTPYTILWGNYHVLADNPHKLTAGQILNILPVEGTYHKWSAGEGLNGVSQVYGVTPEEIINWPGNHLDPETIGDWSNPNIEPGTWLVVPGGRREFVTWSAPRITRRNPAVARHIGPGACGIVVDGAVGIGAFIWPSGTKWISGYRYSPATNHYGIDIKGTMGEPLWASDNGVIVYAGWNNFGYGNMVVIDHGNGWQTLYAHLNVVGVACGQSVFQGTPLGAVGSTGNSSGPHIHFEMMHDSYGRVNPEDFLP
jgi:hypothetical protein